MSLKDVPTSDLVRELITRTDLVRDDGLLSPDIWPLRVKLGTIPCVDGVPVKIDNHGNIWGGVIRRQTGRFPNKLALDGGCLLYTSPSPRD